MKRNPKFSGPMRFRGPDLTRQQRTFYIKYLRQVVMDVFNPPDHGDGAAAFSLEQLMVAVEAVYEEAMAKCIKEAWNGTFNLPLKDKTEHGFKCRIDGLSSEAKKKLQLAFREEFQDARRIRNILVAFSYLETCLLGALNNARRDRDKSLALQKKEELDADMGPGADERRGKKNEMEADRAITTDMGQGAVEKNEMAERKRKKEELVEADRAMAKKLSRAIGADERRVKKNEMSQRKRKKHSY